MKKILKAVFLAAGLFICSIPVKADNPAAELNGTEYETLAEAVEASMKAYGGQIKLLRDVSEKGFYVYPEQPNTILDLSLNLNGFTYQCLDSGIHVGKNTFFMLLNGSVEAHQGSGRIDIMFQSEGYVMLDHVSFDAKDVSDCVISSRYGYLNMFDTTVYGTDPDLVAVESVHEHNTEYEESAPVVNVFFDDYREIHGFYGKMKAYCTDNEEECGMKPSLTVQDGWYSEDPSEFVSDPWVAAKTNSGYEVHRPEYRPESLPTCTEDGGTAHWECVNCGKWFTSRECTEEISNEGKLIPAVGHSVSSEPEWYWWNNNKSAMMQFQCSTCEKTVELDADVSSEFVRPTLDEAGSIVRTAVLEYKGTTYSDQKTETIPSLKYDEDVQNRTDAHAIELQNGTELVLQPAVVDILNRAWNLEDTNGISMDDMLKTRSALIHGKQITAELSITENDHADDAMKEKAEAVLKDNEKIASYYEISIQLRDENETLCSIHTLDNPIMMAATVSVPNVSDVRVIHLTESGAEDCRSLQSNNGKVIFEASSFSPYALVYTTEESSGEIQKPETDKTEDSSQESEAGGTNQPEGGTSSGQQDSEMVTEKTEEKDDVVSSSADQKADTGVRSSWTIWAVMFALSGIAFLIMRVYGRKYE